MYNYISGKVVAKTATSLVVDNNGIGYELGVSGTARMQSFGHLGGGGPDHHGLVSGCLLGVQRAVADSLHCSPQG